MDSTFRDEKILDNKEDLINEKITKDNLDEQLNAPLREAIKLSDGNTQIDYLDVTTEKGRQYSMESTVKDNATIDNLLTKLENDEISVTDKEYKIAKLEAIKGRNLSHLMLNAEKIGGDSKEMKDIKRSLSRLEKSLTTNSDKNLTLDDMDALQEKYTTAIVFCQNYLAKKTSIISAWADRKKAVKSTLERLLYENNLISIGKTLFEIESPEEPITNGVELLAVAKTYQLSRKMKTLKPKKKAFNPMNAFLNFFGAGEQEKQIAEVNKVSMMDMNKAITNNDTLKAMSMLQDGVFKPSTLVSKKKSYSKLNKNEKMTLMEFRQLRQALRNFNEDEVNAKFMKFGNNYANLIQQDNNTAYIEFGNVKIPIGAKVQDVVKSLEDDVINNLDTYSDSDLEDVFSNLPTNFDTMTTGDLIRTRSACIKYLSKKAKIKATDFDNVDVKTLKEYSVYFAQGINATKSITRIVKAANKTFEGKRINNMQTLELNKLVTNKETKLEVEYERNVLVRIKDEKTGVERLMEPEIAAGWTYAERNVKNLVSNIIFDSNTASADKMYDVDKKEQEEFSKKILEIRREKAKKIFKERYEKDKEDIKEYNISEAEEKVHDELGENAQLYLDIVEQNLKETYGEDIPQETLYKLTQEEILKELDLEIDKQKEKARQETEEQFENYEKSKGYKIQESQDTKKILDELNNDDPIDDNLYLEYKRGMHLKQVLLDNIDGISNIIADVFRDKKKNPESMFMAMLDKMPIFMMGDEQAAEIKNSINLALSKALVVISEEIGLDKMSEKDRKTTIDALQMNLGGQVIAGVIEDLDVEKTVELGKVQKDLDGVIDEAASQLQNMLEGCSKLVFGSIENQEEDNEDELEGFAALEQAYEKYNFRQGKSEEEIEAIEQKQNINNLKKKVKDRKEKTKELDKKLKAANKAKDKGIKKNIIGAEAVKIQRAVDLAEEAKNAFMESQKNSLMKTMEDTAKGSKGQGLFIKNVMNTYFKNMPTMDKRSMISYAIRNAKPIKLEKGKSFDRMSEDEKMELASDFLGGLFKGAGPLFQKMLQGLPTGSMPKGIAKAIDETKDSLLPIPDEIVKQQLDSIVKRSNKRISSIKVDKSLGAASVGQAFLCTMKGPEFEEGKKVVVKILRPDVRNRMTREYQVMKNAAKLTDKGMEATFDGTYKRIEEELDLTIEARHVEEGAIYDEKSKSYEENHVKSMKLNNIVAPTADSMVLELAEGTTVKSYIADSRVYAENIMKKYYVRDENGNATKDLKTGEMNFTVSINARKSLEVIKDRYELELKLKELQKRQAYLCELSDKWVTEGVFGKGFYHGDLHSGNMMISDKGLTVIDFGNATQLTEKQQKDVTRMMMAAGTGEVEIFIDGFKNLLEKTSSKEFEKKKDELFWVFKDILRTSDHTSTAQRIAVALVKAQELGLELPPSIANFSSCQLRLQNTVDDINRVIKEIQHGIKEIKEITPQQDEVLMYDECYQIQKESVNASVEEQRKKVKNARNSGIGVSREDMFNELKSKSDSARLRFIKNNLPSAHSYLYVLMETRKNKDKNHSLADEFMDNYNKDNYDYEKGLFKEIFKGTIHTAFGNVINNLEELYTGEGFPEIEVENTEKPGEKITRPVANVDELIKVTGYYYDLSKDEPKVDISDRFKKTEVDKALYAYLEALDSKKKVPDEKIKELEDKLWEEYSKTLEAPESIATVAERQLKVFYPDMVPDQEDRAKGAYYENKQMYRRSEVLKTAEIYYSDSKYGAELKEAVDEYKLLHRTNQAALLGEEINGKKAELVPKEKMNELIKKVAQLFENAKTNSLEEIENLQLKLEYDNNVEPDLTEPTDFLGIMGDVIEKNKVTAALRFGAKAFKYT